MKRKFIAVSAAVLMMFVAVGCSDSNTANENASEADKVQALNQIEEIIKSDSSDDEKINGIREIINEFDNPSVSQNDFIQLFQEISDSFAKISEHTISEDGKTLKEEFSAYQNGYNVILENIASIAEYFDGDNSISSEKTYELYKKGENILKDIKVFAADVKCDLTSVVKVEEESGTEAETQQ